jgi:DNA-binding NtrC family response regulator
LTQYNKRFIIPDVKEAKSMTARTIIEMALAYKGMKNSDLARNLGWSPQLLNKRMNTGKFTVDEWEQIGEAIGAKSKIVFQFPDGKEIG